MQICIGLWFQMYIHHPSDDDASDVMQTQTASKTLNPVYHEIFSVAMTDGRLSQSTLVVQVWIRSMFTRSQSEHAFRPSLDSLLVYKTRACF